MILIFFFYADFETRFVDDSNRHIWYRIVYGKSVNTCVLFININGIFGNAFNQLAVTITEHDYDFFPTKLRGSGSRRPREFILHKGQINRLSSFQYECAYIPYTLFTYQRA